MKTRSEHSIVATIAASSVNTLADAPLPPKLILVPKSVSKDASFLLLIHPRSLSPSQYYFCPNTGIYEFTRIATPKTSVKSCLLAPIPSDGSAQGPEGMDDRMESKKPNSAISERPEDALHTGYLVKLAELYTITPVDPLFLLLPILSPRHLSKDLAPTKRYFLSSDDLFEKLASDQRFSRALASGSTRGRFIRRIAAMCDTVDAGNEKMYRLNEHKLVQELYIKAQNLIARGLPPSMEARFIWQALQPPVMSAKRQSPALLGETPIEEPNNDGNTPSASDSQSSTSAAVTDESDQSQSTTITIPEQTSQPDIPSEVIHLLRLRTALDFMLSAYCPPYLAASLNGILSSSDSPVNFQPCDQYLASIATLRAEAIASRSLADFSRKRGMNEDDDALESRNEKKRKKDEEDKRKKAGESKGVRDLKKVDTTGMKKMSDFFGKKMTGKK